MEDGRTELKRKSAEMNNDSEAVLDSSIKEMRTDRKTASSVEEFLENPRELIPTDEILNTVIEVRLLVTLFKLPNTHYLG
jgi:hypothetical protein